MLKNRFYVAAIMVISVHIPLPAQDVDILKTRPMFEVASLRAAVQDTPPKWTLTPGRLIYSNATLTGLILRAYGIRNFQLAGAIPVSEALRWDLNATIPAGASPDQVNSMLQQLLIERFGLKVHRESKDMQLDALIVAKNGSKLRQAEIPKGLSLTKTLSGNTRMEGRVPISLLVSYLTGYLSRIVIDQTGLTGLYEITLEWVPDEFERGYKRPSNNLEAAGTSGPSLIQALHQLGLDFERRRGPVEMLVIDHVEKSPTEN